MFIHVKTSTEEGMIAFTRAPLCTSLRCVTAQTREPELITAARVNACIGFIPPARFWTVPEAALQGIYTALQGIYLEFVWRCDPFVIPASTFLIMCHFFVGGEALLSVN